MNGFEGLTSCFPFKLCHAGKAAFSFDKNVESLRAGLGDNGIRLPVAKDLADQGGAWPLGDVRSVGDFDGTSPLSGSASVLWVTGFSFPREILDQVVGLVINKLVNGLMADRLTGKINPDSSAHLFGRPAQGDLFLDVRLDLGIF